MRITLGAFCHSIWFLLIFITRTIWAIDCFKCVSINGDNRACEDPFHNNYTTDILETPCWAGRKTRNGLFPATACIKLSGTYEDTGESMVVRGCALDSGTLTIDTEIVRMSHCGGFYFQDRYVSGCLQSCFEDACNAAQQTHQQLADRRILLPLLVSSISSILSIWHRP